MNVTLQLIIIKLSRHLTVLWLHIRRVWINACSTCLHFGHLASNLLRLNVPPLFDRGHHAAERRPNVDTTPIRFITRATRRLMDAPTDKYLTSYRVFFARMSRALEHRILVWWTSVGGWHRDCVLMCHPKQTKKSETCWHCSPIESVNQRLFSCPVYPSC